MKFSEITGQPETKQKLRASVNGGRIPHAQLFLGAEGRGNLPLALAYATYLLCVNRNDQDSCGTCSSCHKMATLTHPDVHFTFPFPSNKADVASELYAEWRAAVTENPYLNYELWMQSLDAGGKQGNIPIKECHAVLKNLSLMAFEAGYKIQIMWLPEFLGNEGNVLLKALEEPAPKTLFLLVAENTEKILSTILSRVQVLRIPPIATSDIADWLLQNKEIAAEEANRVALMAAGNRLHAAELATNAENQYLGPFRNWMGHCFKKNLTEAFSWGDDFASVGREQLKGFFLYSLEIVRAVLVFPVLGESQGLSQAEREFVSKFCNIVNTHAKAELMYNWLNDAAYEIERNGNPKIILSDLSFKLARLLK